LFLVWLVALELSVANLDEIILGRRVLSPDGKQHQTCRRKVGLSAGQAALSLVEKVTLLLLQNLRINKETIKVQ